MKLSDLSRDAATGRLAEGGLYIQMGPFTFHVATTLRPLAETVHLLYADFPVVEPPAIADFHVQLQISGGWRRFWRTQALLTIDGRAPFLPSPVAMAQPLLEWGMNWCVGRHGHRFLTMHAAVVERGGHAAILPGVPGAGKSTLCAALVNRGWRLLSDEYALFRLDDRQLIPMPRPVSLKNESIDIIRRFAPGALIGPACEETHKGTVAHMAGPAESVARAAEPATPAWVIFPAFRAGAPASLEPLPRAHALLRVADNCFNHALRGSQGFEILANLIETCECHEFGYGSLDDAIEVFDGLKAPSVPAGAVGSGSPGSRAPVLSAPPHRPGRTAGIRDRGSVLVEAFRDPSALPSLDVAGWDRLLREARGAGLLSRLAARLDSRDLLDRVPTDAAAQLSGALTFAAHQTQLARWEVNRIRRALARTGIAITLLKGAAYVMADLPPSRGRIFSDVDIIVRRDDLRVVEATLIERGWVGAKMDPYDQRYYRTWMHELPPLHHPRRHTTVDVHHNILPDTSRLRPDSAELLAGARPVADGRFRVLAPADMILHTAVHLFQDGEIHGGLQDLLDVDDLLRHFGTTPGFGEALVARGAALGLERPLFYALRYAERFLDTPVPTWTGARPPGWLLALMDGLVARALLPGDAAPRRAGGGLARWLLYVRSHWLRMPPLLLARHLSHQWLRRFRKDDEHQHG